MERREFSLEAGLNVHVRTAVGVFNANLYQDITGSSNGLIEIIGRNHAE